MEIISLSGSSGHILLKGSYDMISIIAFSFIIYWFCGLTIVIPKIVKIIKERPYGI